MRTDVVRRIASDMICRMTLMPLKRGAEAPGHSKLVIDLIEAIQRVVVDHESLGLKRAELSQALYALVTRMNGEGKECFGPPARAEFGPNGCPVGLLPNGAKVEWLSIADPSGNSVNASLPLRRGDDEIEDVYQQARDQVWWTRHQTRKSEIESGECAVPPKDIWDGGEQAAARIEKMYGRDMLQRASEDIEHWVGLMSAWAWVLGRPFERSRDT